MYLFNDHEQTRRNARRRGSNYPPCFDVFACPLSVCPVTALSSTLKLVSAPSPSRRIWHGDQRREATGADRTRAGRIPAFPLLFRAVFHPRDRWWIQRYEYNCIFESSFLPLIIADRRFFVACRSVREIIFSSLTFFRSMNKDNFF